jgi:hypothetical protein
MILNPNFTPMSVQTREFLLFTLTVAGALALLAGFLFAIHAS